MALWPHEETSALIVHPFCPWVPFVQLIHVNASLCRSRVKSSQHVVLMVHWGLPQCQSSLTGSGQRVTEQCASLSAAVSYGQGGSRGNFFLSFEKLWDSGYLWQQSEPCLFGRKSVCAHSHSYSRLWRKMNSSAGVPVCNFTKADPPVQAGCDIRIKGINTPIRTIKLWPVGYLEKSHVLRDRKYEK